jgi:hypothetical protein
MTGDLRLLPTGGPPRDAAREQEREQVTERVPVGVANAFYSLHGADVRDVPVRRGRAVSREAARLDAAAFSRDGVVYLPDSAGSLGQATARALLAHELTHVVQQRMFGSALPGETSAPGRELEEQARATQHWFLGGTAAVPALAGSQGAPAPVMRHARPARASGTGEAAAVAPLPDSPPAAEHGVQRLVADPSAPSAPAAPAATAWRATTEPGPAAVPDVSGEAVPDRASVAEVRAGIAELRARLSELAGRRAPDLDDPVELDELAVRLYGRLRSKLRFELLVDRERAGLLTDFR